MEYKKLSELVKLANNPRKISDQDFERLKASIQKFGVLEGRPFLVSDRTGELVIIGGNQRYEACKALGIEKVPVHILEDLTEDDEREIVIRDNVSNGQWDWEMLENEWDSEELDDWGVHIPDFTPEEKQEEEEQEVYTTKIEAPIYRPKGEKPKIHELVDTSESERLIKRIDKANIDESIKDFLRESAKRLNVFNYEKIAEYYAHTQDGEAKQLMEDMALVIIDYEKAVELGFVRLVQDISEAITEQENGEQ